MSRRSPFKVLLCDEDRIVLEARATSRLASHAQVVRARIVLLAVQDLQNVEIARRVGVCVDVVSQWRKRFCQEGLSGLEDRPRSGRRRMFGPEVVAGIKAMACEPPEQRDAPLSRWSSLDLADQAVREGLVDSISSSTVRRWLHAAAIKPWHFRSWIFPRDPDFATTAARVLDLYARLFEGAALGPDDYVISADEKSQLQALSRRHPGLGPGQGRPRRVEFEYRRGGTLCYLGAYDVHAARLFGQVAEKSGIVPFMGLVERVMTTDANVRTGGKRQRAAGVVGLWERGKVHHVGTFAELEDQQCSWSGLGNERSPDRMDAAVWAAMEFETVSFGPITPAVAIPWAGSPGLAQSVDPARPDHEERLLQSVIWH